MNATGDSHFVNNLFNNINPKVTVTFLAMEQMR
jgi:hypothetical protein